MNSLLAPEGNRVVPRVRMYCIPCVAGSAGRVESITEGSFPEHFNIRTASSAGNEVHIEQSKLPQTTIYLLFLRTG